MPSPPPATDDPFSTPSGLLSLVGRVVRLTGCAGAEHRGRVIAGDPVSNR